MTAPENLLKVFHRYNLVLLLLINNKFFIRNPITYTDWSYEEEPFESKVKLEGIFNFQIVKPENFLKIVIGLRENYSKPELLEQIRIYIQNQKTK